MALNYGLEAINWDRVEDPVDKDVWEKLTEQFWLDTRVPVANDKGDWRNLTAEEKDLLNKDFGGLTLLDTLQSRDGMRKLFDDVRTQHERAVLNDVNFMESVHAKSYSTIFSTFNTSEEIDKVFEWTNSNKYLEYKANRIMEYYLHGKPLERKAASVLLESFLFYSGFYTPLKFLGEARMVNTAEIIKLILRDESVHGTYIGYKYKLGIQELSDKEQQEYQDWVTDFALDLYENEQKYTAELYSGVGWVNEVNTFVEYNLNKAFANLGYSQLFPTTPEDVDPIVMNGISTSTSNHDFFSQVGNGYRMGDVETVDEGDFSMLDSLMDEDD